MASKRWVGLSDALEDLLNEEYYGDYTSDIDDQPNDELPHSDSSDSEQYYDTEADILARTTTAQASTPNNSTTATTSSSQPTTSSTLSKVRPDNACVTPAAKQSSATKSFCCTPNAIAEFVEDTGNVDTLHVELTQKMSVDCGCDKKTCWQQFTFDEVYSHVLTMRDMATNEKEAYIMGELMASRQPVDSVRHARKKQR